MTNRFMQQGDLDAVVKLVNAANMEPLVPTRFVEVVTEEDGQVVAYASYYLTGRQAVGTAIASSKPGAGRALMEYCFAQAREYGAEVAMAACRQGMVKFHLSLGYVVCGFGDHYYASGEDAVLMIKDLRQGRPGMVPESDSSVVSEA